MNEPLEATKFKKTVKINETLQLVEHWGKTVRTAFFVILVLILSISLGFLVFGFTNMRYEASESQGPYDYNVKFGEGDQAKNLEVVVNVNLSFAKTWFVGEEKNVGLKVSAEKVSNIVQNFSWRIFWVKLFTGRDVWGNWREIVCSGSNFLNASEWSDSYLYKRQNISVGVVNLNYLESVDKAWFKIEIMMDVYHNNTEYSFTFYTPIGEIGPVAVLSPLYSSISLAVISTTTIAVPTILAHQLLSKRTLRSNKKPLP